jgi:hypothetical protein
MTAIEKIERLVDNFDSGWERDALLEVLKLAKDRDAVALRAREHCARLIEGSHRAAHGNCNTRPERAGLPECASCAKADMMRSLPVAALTVALTK